MEVISVISYCFIVFHFAKLSNYHTVNHCIISKHWMKSKNTRYLSWWFGYYFHTATWSGEGNFQWRRHSSSFWTNYFGRFSFKSKASKKWWEYSEDDLFAHILMYKSKLMTFTNHYLGIILSQPAGTSNDSDIWDSFVDNVLKIWSIKRYLKFM